MCYLSMPTSEPPTRNTLQIRTPKLTHAPFDAAAGLGASYLSPLSGLSEAGGVISAGPLYPPQQVADLLNAYTS